MMNNYLQLLLHTQIIDYDACYLCGYLSAQKEVDEEMNPFESYYEASAWREGWWIGWFDEIPAYPLTDADSICLVNWRASRAVRPPADATHTVVLALAITMACLGQNSLTS